MNKIVFILIGTTFLFFDKLGFGQTNVVASKNLTTSVTLVISTNLENSTNHQSQSVTNSIKKSGAELDREFDEWTAPQPRYTNLEHLFGEDTNQIEREIREKEVEEQERKIEIDREQREKKIEANNSLAKQDCDLAKNEYENNLMGLGLSQDVTLSLESSVDSDEFVTVDIYITYNSFDFESRKDLREQTKNEVGTLLLKYLTIHFPKSHISANLHESDLNPNWDK